jgi:serine protease
VKQFGVLVAAALAASLLSACGGAGSGQNVPGISPQAAAQRPAQGRSTNAAKVVKVSISKQMRGRFAARKDNVRMLFYSRKYLKSHPSFKWGPNAVQAAGTSSNLYSNGGPVQTSPKIDVVYWGWQSIPDANADPDDVYDYLNGFFNSIGGGSWINIDTQYYGSNGYVSNTNPQLGSVVYDSSTPPNPYSDADVQQEAQAVASYLGDASVNVNYVVVTPSGYSTSGFGSQWCAYHSSTGSVSYTDLPYIPDVGASCGQGSVNNPGTNDGVSIVGGHEEAETQTDPQPSSGWIDSSGQEIGDKCAWQNLQDNGNAGGYATQPLWDNAIGGCAQSGP